MNNLQSYHIIATALLTLFTQITDAQTPTAQEFMHYAQQQQQEIEDDYAPEGITIEDYVAQVRSDLGGHGKSRHITDEELDTVCNTIKRHLKHCPNISNIQNARMAIHNGLIEHTGNKTARILSELIQQGHQFTYQEVTSIIQSKQENMAARLKQIKHINPENVAQFFGNNLRQEILQQINNRAYGYSHYNNPQQQYYTPQQPKPSAPYMTTPHTVTVIQLQPSPSVRDNYAKKHVTMLQNALQGSTLSPLQIERLKTLVYNTTQHATDIAAEDFFAHAKQSLKTLLKEQLNSEKNALVSIVANHTKLEDSINTTYKLLRKKIKDLRYLDKTVVQNIFSNLQDTIITNMGIECPNCFHPFAGEYKQIPTGTLVVHPVKVRNSCRHIVCKCCAEKWAQYNTTCPVCGSH